MLRTECDELKAVTLIEFQKAGFKSEIFKDSIGLLTHYHRPSQLHQFVLEFSDKGFMNTWAI